MERRKIAVRKRVGSYRKWREPTDFDENFVGETGVFMNYFNAGMASVEVSVDLVGDVQKALVCGVAESDMDSILEEVGQLEERLNRVRSWGGAYSEIDFSDQVKALQGKEESEILA